MNWGGNVEGKTVMLSLHFKVNLNADILVGLYVFVGWFAFLFKSEHCSMCNLLKGSRYVVTDTCPFICSCACVKVC